MYFISFCSLLCFHILHCINGLQLETENSSCVGRYFRTRGTYPPVPTLSVFPTQVTKMICGSGLIHRIDILPRSLDLCRHRCRHRIIGSLYFAVLFMFQFFIIVVVFCDFHFELVFFLHGLNNCSLKRCMTCYKVCAEVNRCTTLSTTCVRERDRARARAREQQSAKCSMLSRTE